MTASDCPHCRNRDYLCRACKMDELEDRYGTPNDHDTDRWVLDDLWHASVGFDDAVHTCACEIEIETPVEWVTEDLRHVPDEFDAPVCRECAATLEGARAETVPIDATFQTASQLQTDGGLSECELVDRAVREAVVLVEAGDALEIAVATTVVDLGLEHRRTDVLERTENRLEQRVATDGGEDIGDLPTDAEEFSLDEHAGPCPSCGSFEIDTERTEDVVVYDCQECPASATFPAETFRSVEAELREKLEDREVVTDGGRDLDFDAVRDAVPFFVRRAETYTSTAAVHLPAEKATEEEPAPRCRYKNRAGVTWRPMGVETAPDWLLEDRLCSECMGTSNQDTYHGRKPADVLEDAGFDIVTDGGRDLDPRSREAFLDGDAHYCDICDRPFDSWDDLANHDCGPVRTDGGRSTESPTDTVELRIRTNRINLAGVISVYGVGLEYAPTFGPAEQILEEVMHGLEDVYPTGQRIADLQQSFVGEQFADRDVDVELVELEGEPSIDPHDGDGGDGDDPDSPGQDGVPIAISDGGRNVDFVAVCEQCGELDRGDLEQAGDALEDHEQFHDTEIKRVATDGGVSVDSGERWEFSYHEVLEDDDGHWWHIVNRFECADSGMRYYRLEDGTHTADSWVHADDVASLFESAGWSTETKPAHERGYRVNGMLTEPANVETWLGQSCVSDYGCDHCGESTEGEADLILDLFAREVDAAWIGCGACGEITEIHGDPDPTLHPDIDHSTRSEGGEQA